MKALLATLRNAPRAQVLLGVLAFGLYLPGFWWGAPHATAADRVQAWGVDDGAPLAPMADVHNILQPKADRNLGYPLMQSFMITAAYAPYLGWLRVSGQFAAPAPAYPFGLADPAAALRNLTLIAHFLSVLAAVGAVLAAYDAARVLWGQRTAGLAGVFALSIYPMFYYARTSNPEAPLLLFSAAALAAFARCLMLGITTRRMMWMGIFIGAALATKEPTLATFIALPFVLLVLHVRRSKAAGVRGKAFWQPLLAGALAAFIVFGFGSGLFVDPKFYFAHVEFARERVQILANAEIPWVKSYPRTLQGHVELFGALASYLVDAMTWPGVVLALAGALLAWRREPLTALVVLPAATYFAVLFWAARAGQLRYLIPVALVLSLFAARAAVWAWESRALWLRAAGATVAIMAIAIGLLRGADLTYVMINDSRYPAAAWLSQAAPAGATVEYFGESAELPPLAPTVITTRATEYRGAIVRPRLDAERIAEIRAGWQQRQPDFIILLPDHSSPPGAPHNVTCPPEIYQQLLDGSLGYRLVRHFKTPPLLPWVRRPALDYPSVNPPIRVFARQPDAPARGSQPSSEGGRGG